MSETEIYLIRHGKTDYNEQFRLQGCSDIPLNAVGLAQAHAAHETLRNVTFDTVYASPLQRAQETAHIVSGLPKECFRIDSRITEIRFGIWEGCDYRTLGTEFSSFFDAPDQYHPPKDGESMGALLQRTGDFLKMLAQLPAGHHVLVASHSTALNAMYLQLCGLPLAQLRKHTFGHCGILRLVLCDGKFLIREEFPSPAVHLSV